MTEFIKINKSDLDQLDKFYKLFEAGKDVRIPTNPKESLSLFSGVKAPMELPLLSSTISFSKITAPASFIGMSDFETIKKDSNDLPNYDPFKKFGLQNIWGATCYFNALNQMMFRIPEFYNALITFDIKKFDEFTEIKEPNESNIKDNKIKITELIPAINLGNFKNVINQNKLIVTYLKNIFESMTNIKNNESCPMQYNMEKLLPLIFSDTEFKQQQDVSELFMRLYSHLIKILNLNLYSYTLYSLQEKGQPMDLITFYYTKISDNMNISDMLNHTIIESNILINESTKYLFLSLARGGGTDFLRENPIFVSPNIILNSNNNKYIIQGACCKQGSATSGHWIYIHFNEDGNFMFAISDNEIKNGNIQKTTIYDNKLIEYWLNKRGLFFVYRRSDIDPKTGGIKTTSTVGGKRKTRSARKSFHKTRKFHKVFKRV